MYVDVYLCAKFTLIHVHVFRVNNVKVMTGAHPQCFLIGRSALKCQVHLPGGNH